MKESQKKLEHCQAKLAELKLQDIMDDEDDVPEGEEPPDAIELKEYNEEELAIFDVKALQAEIALLEEQIDKAKPNLAVLEEYKERERQFLQRAKEFEDATQQRDAAKTLYEDLRKERLEKFMAGFSIISLKLKEMYQVCAVVNLYGSQY